MGTMGEIDESKAATKLQIEPTSWSCFLRRVYYWLCFVFRQGPRAEALMRNAMERGLWVFFQNCHLAPSWMPSLERLIEQIDSDKV